MGPLILLLLIVAPVALCIAGYIKINKLTTEYCGWALYPMQGYWQFDIEGGNPDDPHSAGRIGRVVNGETDPDSPWHIVCGGYWNTLPLKGGVLAFQWQEYTVTFAEGTKSSQPPHGEETEEGHDDEHGGGHDDEHGEEHGGGHTHGDTHLHEGLGTGIIVTRQLPKHFDAGLLHEEVETSDNVYIFNLMNFRFDIETEEDAKTFIKIFPRGSGALNKALTILRSEHEAFTRSEEFEELEEDQKSGRKKLLKWMMRKAVQKQLKKLCGLKLVSIESEWGIDDNGAMAKAIKQKAMEKFAGEANLEKIKFQIQVARKELVKAGIDLNIRKQQNLGEEDLKRAIGIEAYNNLVKYERGIALLKGGYAEGGSALATLGLNNNTAPQQTGTTPPQANNNAPGGGNRRGTNNKRNPNPNPKKP